MDSVAPMEMTRTHASHFGIGTVKNPRAGMKSDSGMIDGLSRPETGSFQQTLMQSLDKVSDLQIKSSSMAEKLMTDPDSINPHDVTEAMAKASTSLKLAQTVLDSVVKGWNDITTTR